ncbi:phosphodiester glycosidase family protein [Chungangia koreensis]|uniref:Phosphodiester glycosidase family protein n=1 Tax=Chungangia koreensis TaxID=752657 RepID=A0ABV8X3R2_9LACT
MQVKKILATVLAAVLVFSSFTVSAATLSPGINHESTSTSVGGYPQKVNKLSVDLTNPYSKIEYGVSNPLNTLQSVSALSKAHTYDQHHVVGAVNASFFRWEDRFPLYLLAENDRIVNLGNVSTNFNDYMHTPAAFGVTADKKAKVGKYNLSHTIEHNGANYSLTSMNRLRDNNESILYTSSWPNDKTRQNQYGIEVVVSGVSKKVDSQLKFGEKVTGTVSAIRPYGQYTSATIPDDGYVISASGTEASKFTSMKVGDSVTLSVDVDSSWKGAQFMLASGPLLVQNGRVDMTIDPKSPRVTERTARTAVATDATGNTAYFVTVDGKQSGYSQGMTLTEFANYLVSIGAYNAINLDGGGSTTMVTRNYGATYPTLANRPSDGSERRVSAILEAISTAPIGTPQHVNVTQTEDGIVAVGASVGYKVNYVLDQYYNALPIDSSKLKLESVSNNVGVIENNKFVGTNAGKGTITATYETATISIPVTVTNSIDRLVATPEKIRLGTGETADFSVRGISSNQKVIFNPSAVNWTVNGNIGSLNGTTFTSGNIEGSGSIVGTFGSTKVTIPVTVSNQPLVLGTFDSTTGLKAETIRANASISTDTKLNAHDGNSSLKLNYDFTSYKDDTSAAYVTWTNGLALEGKPDRIGVWVYGDGNNHWLRGSLSDGNGKEVTVDFTNDGGLNWTGWKYVEATVPSNLSAPLKLNKIYVAEPSSAKKNKSSIWFDKLQTVYHDGPTNELAFTSNSNDRVVPANKQFTVTFSQNMNSSLLNTKYVYVEDQYGVRQPVTVAKGSDGTKLIVNAPSAGYQSGKAYRLVVTHFVTNSQGTRMVKDSITKFKVK